MKAVVKVAKGEGLIKLQDRPVPRPGPGEVLIEVKAAGICGTDIHILHDEFPYWPPAILGHEFSGVIAEVGPDVQGWQPGDRVVGEPHARACGVCYLCRTGRAQICPEKRSPGWGYDGAFARYLVMPVHLLHRIPERVSFESAAVAEPLAIVIHEVEERGRVEAGDVVVVYGPGPIGLLAAAVARTAGAARVIMVGTAADEATRFPLARQVPVDLVLRAEKDDVVEAVYEMSDGLGADLVIEASGAPAAIAQTVQVVRKGGRISAVGIPSAPTVPFPWGAAMSKVCDVRFNMSSSHTAWIKAVRLMAEGRIDPGFVVSHRLPLSQWQEAFRLVESKEGVKVLLYPAEGE